jgi:gas vesicle protein
MSNGQKIFLSFLAGTTTGIIAGLLLAPNTGRETRKKFVKKAGNLKNGLNQQMDRLSTTAKLAKENVGDYFSKS